MRLALLSVALVLIQSPEAPKIPSQLPEAYADKDAYEVYATLLPGEWTWKDAKAEQLLILNVTSPYERAESVKGLCLSLKGASQAEFADALENYVAVNRSPKLLQRLLPIRKEYLLVSREDLKSAFVTERGVGGWEKFYRKNPKSAGYLWFSAVGFNREKTRAIVHIDHSCGDLCGGGTYHVLEKRDGKWVRAKWDGTSCSWAS